MGKINLYELVFCKLTGGNRVHVFCAFICFNHFLYQIYVRCLFGVCSLCMGEDDVALCTLWAPTYLTYLDGSGLGFLTCENIFGRFISISLRGCMLKGLTTHREEGNGRHQFWFTTPPKVGPDVPYTFRLIVYEEIAWLMVNDHVLRTYENLHALYEYPASIRGVRPGILGNIFDGIQRLSKALDKDILWIFQPKKIGKLSTLNFRKLWVIIWTLSPCLCRSKLCQLYKLMFKPRTMEAIPLHSYIDAKGVADIFFSTDLWLLEHIDHYWVVKITY
ncbi:V-type proton ATPase catalytic subunit A [Artemisia annua]|uniref:V-type proton ATPase catalytic subunit A n=1 Tax=Artemisia annua TaxID=35608 RepID=A0A2U1M3I6_ARTAN|nr:V-type proton ATPase catalytic subunit A [Artemisia annua]